MKFYGQTGVEFERVDVGIAFDLFEFGYEPIGCVGISGVENDRSRTLPPGGETWKEAFFHSHGEEVKTDKQQIVSVQVDEWNYPHGHAKSERVQLGGQAFHVRKLGLVEFELSVSNLPSFLF